VIVAPAWADEGFRERLRGNPSRGGGRGDRCCDDFCCGPWSAARS